MFSKSSKTRSQNKTHFQNQLQATKYATKFLEVRKMETNAPENLLLGLPTKLSRLNVIDIQSLEKY